MPSALWAWITQIRLVVTEIRIRFVRNESATFCLLGNEITIYSWQNSYLSFHNHYYTQTRKRDPGKFLLLGKVELDVDALIEGILTDLE
jgi:hypothetical protein